MGLFVVKNMSRHIVSQCWGYSITDSKLYVSLGSGELKAVREGLQIAALLESQRPDSVFDLCSIGMVMLVVIRDGSIDATDGCRWLVDGEHSTSGIAACM